MLMRVFSLWISGMRMGLRLSLKKTLPDLTMRLSIVLQLCSHLQSDLVHWIHLDLEQIAL